MRRHAGSGTSPGDNRDAGASGSGSVRRRYGTGGDQSVLQSLAVADNKTTTGPIRCSTRAARCRAILVSAVDELELTKDWGLYLRPVDHRELAFHLDQKRIATEAPTVTRLRNAAAIRFGGRLVVGAGPTFIFPTASHDVLGQDACGRADVGATLPGEHFIAYGRAMVRDRGMVQTRTR